MRDLWLSTLRTRALRPVPLAIGLSLLAVGIAFAIVDERIGTLPMIAGLYALVAANGLVGEDVRDGTVQLLLARPITRTRYLGARLLGALTAAAGFTTLLLALGAAIARPAADAFTNVAVTALAGAVWTVVVVFFLSTILPGRADVLAALGLFMGLGAFRFSAIETAWLRRAIELVQENYFCIPVVVGGVFTPAAITDELRWASNVLLAVLAAALIFNQRQFGYGD
jgi:ABC-type transport system involved in multi-copper enzyme maturation permease subunit